MSALEWIVLFLAISVIVTNLSLMTLSRRIDARIDRMQSLLTSVINVEYALQQQVDALHTQMRGEAL